ncbi:malonyl CoA-ACP transacylase [Legionella moravica]|uniref:Malonyl CoA-acyl carrier protein transacylase n=1 Tax=Legionella moravica TaxID=39962 RepID=A0A378JWK4_9GAMM|nr:ACP S-malonyltransferase [Legionella moravica]KTD38489.1 malonyl CoA-ACP transacylase [Legionella moravica]STX62816.1 malonyl CoA-ACP transacylase [Legionella moravica]
MTTYMFPGQGSQVIGMGRELFDEYSSYVEQANSILGYDIAALCLTDENQLLNQTQYTQPALFVVNALSYFKKLQEQPEKPDYVMGHSLGEYNALLAAEVFDFSTGLKLVHKRGELMSAALGGGMAAIIGLKAELIDAVLQNHQLNTLSIANYNCYTQIVISGPAEDILSAQHYFVTAGAMAYIPLKVSGAFHSPYMGKAQEVFSEFIKQFTFLPPRITVISNVNAKPMMVSDIPSSIEKQITHPVNWSQSIEYLLDQGETDFIEIGPRKVLTNLVQNIKTGM